MTRNINRNKNIGLLLMATLLITSMSGIVGAAYDEDGNYVEDVPTYVNEEFVYVIYPYDYSAASSTAWAYDITPEAIYVEDCSAYIVDMGVDMTPGIQGPVGEEE